MKRRILPVIIVAFSLTVVVGLIQAARLQADVARRSPAPADLYSVGSGVSFTADPPIQGLFAQAGKTTVFEVTVANTSGSLTDTYELEIDSIWPAALFGPDGTAPLIDTNGSGTVDTGIVVAGESFAITTKVETPANEIIGDENMVELTITSFISPSLITTTIMQGAVPAPFVQTLYEQSNQAMSLIMSQPNGAWQQQTTPDSWFDEEDRFPELAATETLSGYIYAWTRWWVPGTLWVSEVEYALTDKAGSANTQLAKVADHSTAGLNTFDRAPAVAVAPDGRIGVAWYRNVARNDYAENNDNVYLAILDPAGQPITDTINLTSNSDWRTNDRSTFDVPRFLEPRIAATGDNHFLVTWQSTVMTYTEIISAAADLNDIYYTIYRTDGVTATEIVNLTQNVLGEEIGFLGSVRPAVSAAGADRVLMTWNQRRPLDQGGDDIFYTVIDSSGSTIKEPAKLSDESELVDWSNFDVVELSNGDFIAAWQAYGCEDYPPGTPRLRYARIKGNNYNRAGLPACLPPLRQADSPTIVAEKGDEGISLVADNEGQAILTWTDWDPENRGKLYYALLRSNANLATYPMVFYQNGPGDDSLSTGLQGYGGASRIYMDAAIVLDSPRFTGSISDTVAIDINYSNLGVVTGTNLAITLALDPGLAYLSDNAPITPTVQGSDVIWNLPQLRSWEDESFSVEVEVSKPVGFPHSFPLTATITVSGTEASLANNIDRAWLVVDRPLFLPLVIKPE